MCAGSAPEEKTERMKEKKRKVKKNWGVGVGCKCNMSFLRYFRLLYDKFFCLGRIVGHGRS